MGLEIRLLAVLALIAARPTFAQTSADVNGQIATTRSVEQVALSPDGRTIVAIINDPTASGGRGHLWALPTSGAPRQLTGTGTDSGEEDSDPAWSPDGRAVLFVRKLDDRATVDRIDLANGHRETLALASDGPHVAGGWDANPPGKPLVTHGFAIASSGSLAVWASDPSDARERTARKDDQHLFGGHNPSRLLLVRTGSQPLEVPLPQDVRGLGWSQDGHKLLVVSKPASDDLGAANRLWLVDEAAAAREVRGTAENVQTVSWLPDGRIAYFARCSRDAPIVCRDLFVQALDGSPPRDLTDRIDGSVITGVDNVTTAGPVVTRGGDILVTVARHFDEQVARIGATDGHIAWISGLPAVVKAIATNAAANAFALIAAERGGITTVRLTSDLLDASLPITTPLLQPAQWTPLHATRLQWTSDHLTIDGLLYLPPGAGAGKRVPLVVDVHGGPAGRFEDSDTPLVRLLLAQGWAVLRANPRGSLGYGVDFLASLKDDLGGGDYRDIMAGVDAALARAPIDRDRMALIGYSYGASMTTVVLGRTTRFKALVAAAPVVDQISEYGTEGSSWYDRWYFGQPWRQVDRAWRQSSLSLVTAARTPLLLLHGESDPVNPVGQSYELYRALHQEGAPVELMLFPRETHLELGRNFYGSPSVEPHHGLALRQRMLEFLGKAFADHAATASSGNPS